MFYSARQMDVGIELSNIILEPGNEFPASITFEELH